MRNLISHALGFDQDKAGEIASIATLVVSVLAVIAAWVAISVSGIPPTPANGSTSTAAVITASEHLPLVGQMQISKAQPLQVKATEFVGWWSDPDTSGMVMHIRKMNKHTYRAVDRWNSSNRKVELIMKLHFCDGRLVGKITRAIGIEIGPPSKRRVSLTGDPAADWIKFHYVGLVPTLHRVVTVRTAVLVN